MTNARDALAAVTAQPAWALIRLQDAADVTLLGGQRVDLALLGDIPLESVNLQGFDRLVLVPYRQISERGFEAHDDATPLSSIDVDVQVEVPTADLIADLPTRSLRSTGFAGFEIDDDEYADLVRAVIRDEIGNGEGANLVIARDYLATIEEWDAEAALSVFRRLLESERGAYWTFLVFTGDRYLVGASPERHLRVEGGAVSMNPISGTFRLRPDELGTDSGDGRHPSGPGADLEARLLRFLADEKEIYELFMVVDEELKMMCALCSEGGSVLGPFLKPMSHLVHTEYLLAGRSSLDVRDVLRGSMFAATVTGSPVQNACRLIKRYEKRGRGYYGSVLALFGHDESGATTLDAPIVLRTADVSADGRLRVTAGATLVRDSDPTSEVAETHAKAAGILTAFGLVDKADTPSADVSKLVSSAAVTEALAVRNERLSRFWLSDQSGASPSAALAGKRVVVLDGEDDFVTMLRHLLHVLGLRTEVVGYRDYRAGDFDGADLVIVGPGPGDPRDLEDRKIATIRAAVDSLLESKQPFLAVCLGHQVLCGALGLDLAYKDIVFQGTQTAVDLVGRLERVGFYNTFVARVGTGRSLPVGVSVDADLETGDIHAVRGPHYTGIQFHAESILTEHGRALVETIANRLLAP